MRDRLKFRAWDLRNERMCEVRQMNWHEEGCLVGLFPGGAGWTQFYELRDIILMQCTGIEDCNGKEIYEGDILQFEDNVTVVEWNENHFQEYHKGDHNYSGLLTTEGAERHISKIIGNIYED